MISGKQETRIQQLLSDELPESEWPELRELLQSSEEARRIYCTHARMISQLGNLRRERMTLAAPAVPMDYMIETQRKRHFRLASMATAAVIVASLVLMRLVLVREPGGTATLAAAADSRFSVTHAADTGNPVDPGILRDGSRLHLEQGVIELEFDSGVRSVVRGPADMTVVHKGELRLDQGTGWFHVPKKAAGFRVITPRAVVTDLGTEFGVITRSDLADSVHLFKGAVDVQTRIGASESAKLRGNGARNITLAGRLHPTVARRELFFTDLPRGLPSLHWSFDETSAAAWRASGTTPEAASVTARPSPSGDGMESVPGRFGNALRSKGGTAWVSDWPGIAGRAPRTLAFWLRLPPRNDYIHPIAGWGHRYGDDDTTLASFFAYAETVDGVTVAGASLGGYWIKGTTRIDDDRWHHLAITASGRQFPDGRPELRLYLDGREETVTTHWTRGLAFSESDPLMMATDTTHPEARPLTLLSQLFPGAEGGHAFPAEIDELGVVEGALGVAEIGELYQNTRRAGEARNSD